MELRTVETDHKCRSWGHVTRGLSWSKEENQKQVEWEGCRGSHECHLVGHGDSPTLVHSLPPSHHFHRHQ